MMLEPLLLAGALMAALLWAILSAFVLHVDRRRRSGRAIVSTVLSTLRHDDVRAAPVAGRVARVAPLLARVSRDMVLFTAADAGTPREDVDVLAAYLLERWGEHVLLREAGSHRLPRDVWRRAASLKVLVHLAHPQQFALLARAADARHADVASVALSLLGASTDPRAIPILLGALKSHRHPASRVAVHLEHSPLRPAAELRALLSDGDPVVRFWAATLLSQYPEIEGLEQDLAALIDDRDARVRKAAVQSLGKIGDTQAGAVAMHLLRDPAPFVRAHAARALGELEYTQAAAPVAELLGDADWWVRAAAKGSLEMMGGEVWPVLMRCLDHPDGFVRNGAAEVFQNLGILDNLIVMEAASENPSGAKIDMLRRIVAAGGTRLTTSLVERAGGAAAARVRELLVSVGLQDVGVC
jgi:HEAT repeat protein